MVALQPVYFENSRGTAVRIATSVGLFRMIDPLYSLLAGSLPGIFIRSYFAIRVPQRALKLVLATTLFVVASRIAYDQANTATSIFATFSQ